MITITKKILMGAAVSLLLTSCFLPIISTSTKLDGRDICFTPSANLTIVYQLFPNDIEKKVNIIETETLEDFYGFSVELMKDFSNFCQIGITLIHWEKAIDNLSTNMITKLSPLADSVILPMLDLFSSPLQGYHFSQTIAICPSVLIYRHLEGNNFNHGFLLNYLYLSIITILIGSLVLIAVVKLEGEDDQSIYKEVVWNFFLSPFGLCGSALMNTFSRKIFTLCWVWAWFIVVTAFSAEFSSTMTVNKLQSELNSFRDVLGSDRNFLWPAYMKHYPKKIIQDLKVKYDRFSRDNDAYRNFEMSLKPDFALNKKFLDDGAVIFTNKIDLKLYMSEELMKDNHYLVREDWSIPYTFHYKFKVINGQNNFDAFNLYIKRIKSNGYLEELIERWFGIEKNVDPGNTKRKEPIRLTIDLPWTMALCIAGIGSTLSLMVSLYHFFMRKISTARQVTGQT